MSDRDAGITLTREQIRDELKALIRSGRGWKHATEADADRFYDEREFVSDASLLKILSLYRVGMA